MQAQTGIVSQAIFGHPLLVSRFLELYKMVIGAMLIIIIAQSPLGIEVHIETQATE